MISELKANDNTSFKRDAENDFGNTAIDYKWNALDLNKGLRKCEKIKREILIKNNKKNQIERYFNAVDQQLQNTMKKMMYYLYDN